MRVNVEYQGLSFVVVGGFDERPDEEYYIQLRRMENGKEKLLDVADDLDDTAVKAISLLAEAKADKEMENENY